MEMNIGNLPKAILYFIVGVFINIFLYYTFGTCDSCGNLIGLLTTGILDIETNVNIIWGGIMLLSVIINLAYPVWILFDTEEEQNVQ